MVVVVRNDMEWLWTFILYVDRISNRSIIVDGDCICVGFYCRAWSVLFLWPYKWIIGLCRDLLDISLIDDLSLHLPHPSGTNKVGTSKGGGCIGVGVRVPHALLEICGAVSHWHDGCDWWQPFSHPHCSLRIRFGLKRKRKRKIWILFQRSRSLSLRRRRRRAGGWHNMHSTGSRSSRSQVIREYSWARKWPACAVSRL
jgi:hypothetical protein